MTSDSTRISESTRISDDAPAAAGATGRAGERASRSSTGVLTDDLVQAVLAVPGVGGLEPGVTSTLRALDARLRRRPEAVARYGLHLEEAQARVVVEVGLRTQEPLRQVVEDLQATVAGVLEDAGHGDLEVLVRVQSA
ncbi:hypothetical protein [Brachybacterium subflavum]|uniref:hypothetical protein n=1 Tax=Brachybacterium subflavum TaxID=2585206 RepID=UPI0012667CF6|nr:hypothetical protein [Brachybacterium subflavum]